MINLSEVEARRKRISADRPVAPCPRCATVTERHERRTRMFWEADLRHTTIAEVDFACFLCPTCPEGERWFTTMPSPYQTPGQYSLPTREAILDLIRRYKMPLVTAARMARELLHLPLLHETTILDWYREAGAAIDRRAHVAGMLEVFSGQMALDEVYDGGLCQIVATDPINGLQLDYELIDRPATKEDVRRFLERLKTAGFQPQLVTTDGSDLYPSTIAEVWPSADHQRCVFHFIKQAYVDLAKAFWAAYNTLPKPPKRKRGRPKKRGRPRKDKQKRENRAKVRKARYLVFKRKEHLHDEEKQALKDALRLCPPLQRLRRFVLDLLDLFGPGTTTPEAAQSKRRALLDSCDYQELDGLAPVMKRLSDNDLFARLTRYLSFENAKKTSNHVERENREFRNQQKTRYRFRSLSTISALLEFLLTRRPAPAEPERLQRKAPSNDPATTKRMVSTAEEEVSKAA